MNKKPPLFWERVKNQARVLRRDALVMYLALRHPATPWYAKAVAALVVVYAVSPFDLIPDFIPVLGWLDDIIIVPLGVALVRRLIPDAVLSECRVQAISGVQVKALWKWLGGILMISLWLLAALWMGIWGWHWLGH